MDRTEEYWKKQLKKLRVVQKCPKCGELALNYSSGRIKCTNCDFDQNIGEVQ